jgi:alpha-N-arabinofuranosidase
MTVRLLTLQGEEISWGDASLAPGPWHTVQRTFRRAPGRAIPSSTPLILDIQLEHPITIWLDRCSLIPADDRYGWDPEVITWMKEAQLPLLRFPGGNFSSGYHWRDGVGPVESRPVLPNPAWPEIEWNDVGTDEWLQLCHMVGCEALICVNGGNGTPEEAAQWVEYCNGSVETPMGALRAANGHPAPYKVQYWEIGNELYGDWQIGHTNAQDYADRFLIYRDAMLAVDPDLHIIANGHDAEWNKTLMKRARENVRALSVHTLVGHHIPANSNPEAVYREFMGFAAQYGDELDALAAPMKDMGYTPRLGITELSIFTFKPQLPNVDNLTEALYYSGIVNAAIRSEGLVKLITHSALINHSAGLVKQRGVVFPHPMWWALHLYSTQAGIQPVSIQVTGPTFSCSGEWLKAVEQIPTVDGVALLSEDRKSLVVFLTNRDLEASTELRLSIEGFLPQAQGTVSILTGESFLAHNTWQMPDQVRIRSHAIRIEEGEMTYTLPPHSLTRLVLGR